MLVRQKVNTTRFTRVTSGGTLYTFSTALYNSVVWLPTKKNADNGLGEAGTSGALETALAYRAIAAASPANAALGRAQDYLIASQSANGTRTGDSLQTARVLPSFAAT